MALPHTKTSGSARTAVIYITIGAIMDVWTALWYLWMSRHGTTTDGPYFWCYGFFFTGLTLIIIGLALGQIGRAARHAEAPPDTTSSNAAVQAQQPVVPPSAVAAPANGLPQAPMAVPAGVAAPPLAVLRPEIPWWPCGRAVTINGRTSDFSVRGVAWPPSSSRG